MQASRSNGGSTCTMPLLMLQGPNPSTSMRCLTAIVRSWCHPKDQFCSALGLAVQRQEGYVPTSGSLVIRALMVLIVANRNVKYSTARG